MLLFVTLLPLIFHMAAAEHTPLLWVASYVVLSETAATTTYGRSAQTLLPVNQTKHTPTKPTNELPTSALPDQTEQDANIVEKEKETSSTATSLHLQTSGVTHTALPSVYSLDACLENPDVRNVTIESSEGIIRYQSTNDSNLTDCEVVVVVPREKVVKFQITLCSMMILDVVDRYTVSGGEVSMFKSNCAEATPSFQEQLSTANKVVIGVHFQPVKISEFVSGKPQLNILFSSAEKPSKRLEITFLTWFAGYVQTPAWNQSLHLQPFVTACAAVNPPAGYAVFLTFLHFHISYSHHVGVFSGHCDTAGSYRKIFSGRVLPEPLLFPESVRGEGQNASLLPVTVQVYFSSYLIALSFQVYFSFHLPALKPRKEARYGDRWNCSASVWPDLAEHFPCDLVSQCAQSEDEARCPYTSEKCGEDKAEAGGRCYQYEGKAGSNAWVTAEKMCRQKGSFLVSLESPEESAAIHSLLQHTTPPIWIGLRATVLSSGPAAHNSMYSKTWMWTSESIAYYFGHILGREMGHCALMDIQSPRIYLRKCERFVFSAFLCEVFRASSHEQIVFSVPNATLQAPVSLETCPFQHVTHATLACEATSACRSVASSGEWYEADCPATRGLPQRYFYCGVAEEFVSYTSVCDSRHDCSGGEDEHFCLYPVCPFTSLDCGQGQCVDFQRRCDGFTNCGSGLDEKDCHQTGVFGYNAIHPPAIVHFDRPGGFTVTALPYNTTQCPDTHFQCHHDGYCLPVYVRCNDVNDCPDHEDELWCNGYRCPGFYRCRGTDRTICVHVDHLCDGRSQCPRHDDELLCDGTCPESCTCFGLAFTCTHTFQVNSFPQLRYLEARGSELQQSDVNDNSMLIHLGVQACKWSNLSHLTLPNLHSLDLSDNLLNHVNFSCFVGVYNLRRLSLAGNPINRSLNDIQGQYLPSVKVFNVSRVPLYSLDMGILSTMLGNLQVLDVSQSEMKVLLGQYMFHNLHTLDLRGCPLLEFTPNFMKDMGSLTHVFSDNYKICCPAVLPIAFKGTCLAPSDEISSCGDLLKSGTYRFALAVCAVVAILGNLSSLIYRLLFSREQIKLGFSVFVLNLCTSDLVMGVYLAVIGVADRLYAGTYLWNDASWKESEICQIAGFLSFLSSEVSSFIICLITLDRFLVLRFPFSQVRFGVTSAHTACVLVWVLGLILATVPLLPVTSHWDFYHQTGICIPLPVTRAEFAGHSYSFSVMIVCNLVLFLLIAVGQSLIFWSVRANAMSEDRKETTNKGGEGVKSKEAVIARRLLTIAMSDFLCWFPIGLCGLLAAADVVIPGEVNVAMAIFVLPLNSALNPFLYTLNIVLEKRQKAKELRFQKFVLAQIKNYSLACKTVR